MKYLLLFCLAACGPGNNCFREMSNSITRADVGCYRTSKTPLMYKNCVTQNVAKISLGDECIE